MKIDKKDLVARRIEQIDERISRVNVEAAKLYEDAIYGDRRAGFQLAEEIATGDLPVQLLPLIRRTLLTNYGNKASTWDKYTDVELVQSIDRAEEFMKVNFLDQSNIPGQTMGEGFVPGGLPRVAPGTKYPTILPQGTRKYISATSYGEGFGIDWASIVNSRGANANLIQKGLDAFATHVANQEDIVAARLLMTGGAINASTFNGNTGYGGNHLASDAPLTSILDVQAAVQQAQTFWIDYQNIIINKFIMVVAPQNVQNAKQVLSSKTVQSIPATSARGLRYDQQIDLGAEIEVVGLPWLTSPGIGGSAASTAWFLIPVGLENPVLVSTRLEGYETPSYFIKTANSTSVGGGDTSYLDGDFDSDSIESKVRHVAGANSLWTQGIVYSLGTGTATAGPVAPLVGLMPANGTTAAGAGQYPAPVVGS